MQLLINRRCHDPSSGGVETIGGGACALPLIERLRQGGEVLERARVEELSKLQVSNQTVQGHFEAFERAHVEHGLKLELYPELQRDHARGAREVRATSANQRECHGRSVIQPAPAGALA